MRPCFSDAINRSRPLTSKTTSCPPTPISLSLSLPIDLQKFQQMSGYKHHNILLEMIFVKHGTRTRPTIAEVHQLTRPRLRNLRYPAVIRYPLHSTHLPLLFLCSFLLNIKKVPTPFIHMYMSTYCMMLPTICMQRSATKLACPSSLQVFGL